MLFKFAYWAWEEFELRYVCFVKVLKKESLAVRQKLRDY